MEKLSKTQQRALDNVTAGHAPSCNAETLEALLGFGLIVYVPMTLTTDGHYRPTTATERAGGPAVQQVGFDAALAANPTRGSWINGALHRNGCECGCRS